MNLEYTVNEASHHRKKTFCPTALRVLNLKSRSDLKSSMLTITKKQSLRCLPKSAEKSAQT